MKTIAVFKDEMVEVLRKAEMLGDVDDDVYEVEFVEFDNGRTAMILSISQEGSYSPAIITIYLPKIAIDAFLEEFKANL